MKIKVCGLRDPENISEIIKLNPDYTGFIFYEKSSRFAGNLSAGTVSLVRKSGSVPVAVTVNMSEHELFSLLGKYEFEYVQLHGKESPELCFSLKKSGYTVFKAVSVENEDDLKGLSSYEGKCDYFLFDTKTPLAGGSGKLFDWDLLKMYDGKIPFFLSGGIGPGDIEKIKSFKHDFFFGVDVNSRFEISPALKDVKLLEEFISKLKK